MSALISAIAIYITNAYTTSAIKAGTSKTEPEERVGLGNIFLNGLIKFSLTPYTHETKGVLELAPKSRRTILKPRKNVMTPNTILRSDTKIYLTDIFHLLSFSSCRIYHL
jgi:hypothetical protein